MRAHCEQVTITGEEKAKYLRTLDAALGVLAQNFLHESDAHHIASLQAFGSQEKWDWSRLPRPKSTYATLAQLVELVRASYAWFDTITNLKEPVKNRRYFDSVRISTQSGLPWVYDIIELNRLQQQSDALCAKLPSYQDCVTKLQSALLEDTLTLDAVPQAADEIVTAALKRSFLEQLKGAGVVGWDATGYRLAPHAKKIMSLGGEELWSVVCIRFSLASSQFQLYVLDVWQDIRAPQMSGTVVSPELSSLLKFGDENTAWYVLQTIDERFKSLHPVHVTKTNVGPFENKCAQEDPERQTTTPIIKDLLAEDVSAGLLRVSRQYTYAPNHKIIEGELRQVVYRDDWRDEIIVCPAKYASRVAKSVLGTKVRVVEV